MRPRKSKRGSALIVTLLLLALMLTLVLYYVSMVRLDTQLAGFGATQHLSREAIHQALGEAMAELESQHLDRAAEGRASLAPTSQVEWVSRGSGGAVTGLLTEAEVIALGWPKPAAVIDQLENAQWILGAQSNGWQQASAWAVVPLTGLLDPEGMISGWNTDALGYSQNVTDGRVYFSAAEFREAHPEVAPVFMPGAYARDRGWYDFNTFTWQTNATVGEVLSMHPLTWSDAAVDALFQERYPTRDFAAIADAFKDFRAGRTLPTNPNGITAVPVPMFNEVTATMSVRNLGETIEITHRFELEIWYPYTGNINNFTYEVPLTPPLEAVNPASAPYALTAMDSDADWKFSVPGGEAETAFAVLTLNVISGPQPAVPGQVMALAWNLEGLVIEQLGEGAADRLPSGLRLLLPELTVPPSGGVVQVTATLEVQDPVLNHDPARWVSASTSSLSAVNQAAKDLRDNDALNDDLMDDWVRWTPAGRAGEWEEGWIGFLPLDTPWRSVDLFAEDGQWWLKHTRRPDWVPGIWMRNKVNPNADQPEAFSAVFLDVPQSQWPGDGAAEPITTEKALTLGGELSATSLLDEGADQRGEWSDALEKTLLADGGDRQRAESVVNELLERLTLNNQLYGLILVSEVRMTGGSVRSRQRQVYVVWLDPYPTENGRNSMMKISYPPFLKIF